MYRRILYQRVYACASHCNTSKETVYICAIFIMYHKNSFIINASSFNLVESLHYRIITACIVFFFKSDIMIRGNDHGTQRRNSSLFLFFHTARGHSLVMIKNTFCCALHFPFYRSLWRSSHVLSEVTSNLKTLASQYTDDKHNTMCYLRQ